MDLRRLTHILKGAARGGHVNVSHPTHVAVTRNIGGSNRHTSVSSTQNVHIVQDGQETHRESTTETSIEHD